MSDTITGQIKVDGLDGTRSRGETKSRKALSKLGLVKVPGIERVVMRRPRGQLFVVARPEVFKSATADVYVVFGESSNEDASQNQFTTGANQLAQAEQQERLASESRQKSADKAAVTAESNDDGDVDETGLEPSEIEMVMDQANCSRAKAVSALKKSKGDLVQAILEAN